MNIGEKTFVSIDYKLSLDSGEEVDSSPEGKPLNFVTGTGRILPGLENALVGKVAGDSASITLEPEKGYGPVNKDLMQDIPKDQFPDKVEIKEGMAFKAQGPHGPVMITVNSVNDDDTVTIDLNHPMAGKRLHFEVKVVEVREPLEEELAQLAAQTQASCGCASEGKSSCDPSACSC